MGADPDLEIQKRAEAKVGCVLREKWRLDRLLGLGGMAAVYAATHRNGSRAAIKMLHPEAALVPDVKARFLREGYLANKVDHPDALSILDDDIDSDGTVFLVMDLLHGETLDVRWAREAQMQWQDVFVIADRVLDVLVAAHAKDIVHRDLKPGNMFLDVSGAVKILDFGIARLQTVSQSSDSTGRNVSLGTPGFMPPEQARGRWELVDAQSDLWAVGATMFALLAGRYVHEAPTVNEQLLAAMTQPAVPIESVVPSVPPDVAAVINKSLAFEKQARWLDARAMQRAVREAYLAALGEPISANIRLSFPGSTSPIPVQADAPTLAAPAGVTTDRHHTTARPVTGQRPTPPPIHTGRRWVWPAVAIGLGAVAVGVAVVGALDRDPTPASPSSVIHTVTVPVPAEAPALRPSVAAVTEPPVETVDAGSEADVMAESAKPPTSQLRWRAKPKPKPKPVNIFDRRR